MICDLDGVNFEEVILAAIAGELELRAKPVDCPLGLTPRDGRTFIEACSKTWQLIDT